MHCTGEPSAEFQEAQNLVGWEAPTCCGSSRYEGRAPAVEVEGVGAVEFSGFTHKASRLVGDQPQEKNSMSLAQAGQDLRKMAAPPGRWIGATQEECADIETLVAATSSGDMCRNTTSVLWCSAL